MTTRRNLWIAMEDDATTQILVELARRHSKLALEHLAKDTSPDRRKSIRGEIESLREIRDAILSQYVEEGGEKFAK
jgi:hypothetical protein